MLHHLTLCVLTLRGYIGISRRRSTLTHWCIIDVSNSSASRPFAPLWLSVSMGKLERDEMWLAGSSVISTDYTQAQSMMGQSLCLTVSGGLSISWLESASYCDCGCALCRPLSGMANVVWEIFFVLKSLNSFHLEVSVESAAPLCSILCLNRKQRL